MQELMKVPWIARVVQGVCVLTVLSNFISLVPVTVRDDLTMPQRIGTLAYVALIAVYSIWVFMRILRRRLRGRWEVSLYLWTVLFAYFISNAMRIHGFFLPSPDIADKELAGAAFYELMRLLLPLFLIIWTGFSRDLKRFANSGSNEPARED